MDVNELKCKITEKIEDIIRRMKKGHKIDSLEKRLLLQDIHRLRTLTGEQFNWLLVQGIVEEKLLCEDPCFSFVLDPDPGPEPLPELNVVLTINHVVSCFEGADGEITATVTGGFAPYTYFWNDPFTQTTSTATNLTAGTYSVTVIDSLSTSTTKTITLTQPAKLTVQLNQINPTELGVTDGEIESIVSGGTIPYSYYWTGPNDFTSVDKDLIDLEVGEYTLTVTDANGCVAIESITLVEQIDYTPINYGLMYNWWTAVEDTNITSSDNWRVSTSDDWHALVDYLGGDTYDCTGPLKSIAPGDWLSPNVGATNSTGFSAKGVGIRGQDPPTFHKGMFSVGDHNHVDIAPYWCPDRTEDDEFPWMFCFDTVSTELMAGNDVADEYQGAYIRLVKTSTTLSDGQNGLYIGNDGKRYKTICINGVEWLAVNLAETKFRNGTLIPFNGCDNLHNFTDQEWFELTSQACCPYNNDWSLVPMEEPIGEPCPEPMEFGLLYNWYAISDERDLANEDWHVQTSTDFNILGNYIGVFSGTIPYSWQYTNGCKLKLTKTWGHVNDGMTNEFGFNAKAAGLRMHTNGMSLNINHYGKFWVQDEDYLIGALLESKEEAIYDLLRMQVQGSVNLQNEPIKLEGRSVRLVKDTTELTHGQTGIYIGNDGQEYPTVCIGNQEWLAKNLAETKFRNGNVIPFNGCDDLRNFTNQEWIGLETAACCPYSNNWSLVPMEEPIGEPCPKFVNIKYGLLYNWHAAVDPMLCREGWKVPSDEDWSSLVSYLGSTDAGAKLKSTRTDPDEHPRWDSPNTGATNEVGFNSVPGGIRYYVFDHIGKRIYSWSSSSYTASESLARVLFYDQQRCFQTVMYLHAGLAIRLLKITTSLTHGQTGTYIGNDGKVYNTICIGTQEWLAEDLCETKFRNGDWIRGFDGGVYTPISSSDWTNATEVMLCAYGDDISNAYEESPKPEGTGILDTGIWNDSGIYKDQKPWNDGE